MSTSFRVIRTERKSDAFLDPWGGKVAAEVIIGTVEVTDTGESHPYNNGYTDEQGRVYEAEDGDRCYGYAPIDYGGGTRYIWLPGSQREGAYHRPSHVGRYVLAGVPLRWNRETHEFEQIVLADLFRPVP